MRRVRISFCQPLLYPFPQPCQSRQTRSTLNQELKEQRLTRKGYKVRPFPKCTFFRVNDYPPCLSGLSLPDLDGFKPFRDYLNCFEQKRIIYKNFKPFHLGGDEKWSQFGRRTTGTQRFHRYIEERFKRETKQFREH